ncbi:annexin B9-like [Penaeus chinensis]|uniref:annexin B9-like n=1 Tax=Penaeus chinensis TaxID=139456 RepID=UPI001FB85D97|nr:annexin B9-like [Penaeus chinensis]
MAPTVHPVSPFDPSSDSSNLRKAMKGLGTDEDAIISILTSRTSDQRQAIMTEYNHTYNRDLVKDLKKELHGKFEDVVVALMTPLPAYLAEELHHAMSGKGTTEKTLVEILCTRDNASIRSLKDAYELKYNKKLDDVVKSEVSGDFEDFLMSLLACVRDEESFDPALSLHLAEKLYKAGEGQKGTDEEELRRILVSYSYQQLKDVFSEYHKLAGKTLGEALDDELSGDLRDAMKAAYMCIQNHAVFFAQELHAAMAGFRTRNRALIRLVVTRCEIDMQEIKLQYQSLYQRPLEKDIKGDTSGDYRKILMALVVD